MAIADQLDMRETDSAHSWRAALAPYERPETGRGVLQIASSLLPYLALSTLSYLTLGASIALTAALAVVSAGFLVRTFVVFHDCAHGSLLPSRRANARVGTVLGLFVLTPFVRWRHEHAVHHATSGDLERRGTGDVETLTVTEYHARPRRGRIAYRLFRNPLVMFGLGPIFAMIIGPRIPAKDARPRMRRSVLATDAVLAVIFGLIFWLLGWQFVLEVWLPAALLAGSAGIWLFYVQHQFEDAYWQTSEDWCYAEAALQGSTYLRLPKLLQFFSGSIGLHHVHHLNSKIPNYNLQRAHDSHPVFSQVPTIGIADGMRAVRFKLWDERSGKMVTFAQARRAQALKPARSAAVGAEA
ncbi:MAG: fatty acid desaturase [Acidobacteriota bacterium]|nr:fatty acid desaturase [Acidobacteriota bacterium]